MINYFEAAEKTLRARGLLETALGNLERKKERILRYGAPSEYPSADMSKPYTGAKSVNDALADCLELAEVMREIKVTGIRSRKSTTCSRRWTRTTRVSSGFGTSSARARTKSRRPYAIRPRRASTTSVTRRSCASLSSTSARELCRLCEAFSNLFSCIEKNPYGNLHFPRAIIEA